LDDPIVADELALHRRVREQLARRKPDRGPDEKPIVRELERIREELVESPDGKDATMLREQWHRQSSLLRQLRASRDRGEVDPRTPYFAHLRLREDDVERDLCLGRVTCVEDGLRIVDWRNAPVSRIFYRYQQGDDYEEEFAGRTRDGTVVARRTLRIRDSVLDRIEAPEGIYDRDGDVWARVDRQQVRLSGGEATALRAHATDEAGDRRLGTDLEGSRRRADKRLPEITGLIDPSQFELITRPSSGFLAIRGTAGSGKTTVALHRIAYLAYADEAIDSERTLFVVFSRALKSYVGHVLPSLGVEDARIVTFREWAAERRRRHFPRLPTGVREDTPAEVQRLKLHPGFADALERHVAETPGPGTPEQTLDDWVSVSTRGALLRECCERIDPGAFSADAIRRSVEWSRRRNEELFGWLDGSGEAALDAEDDALLLRAWQLRMGPLRHRKKTPLRYKHVAIDEVQDFAPVEVRVLIDCLDRNQSLTLAGDTQQHVSQHGGFTSWTDFLQQLGLPGSAVETLRVSYRSPRPIVEFSRAVLGDLAEDESPDIPREGPDVELFRFTDRGACVAFLADALRDLLREEPLASVAVLTPSSESSALYHEGLARCELPGLHRVAHQDFSFAPGVEVTEVDQAKGLEFDYVVLVDVTRDAYPEEAPARRRLHVGATRAVHQLWLTCVGTPSALVGDMSSSG
jgi:DNA helicase-2/ATP-dependent DNA helicase PcrA